MSGSPRPRPRHPRVEQLASTGTRRRSSSPALSPIPKEPRQRSGSSPVLSPNVSTTSGRSESSPVLPIPPSPGHDLDSALDDLYERHRLMSEAYAAVRAVNVRLSAAQQQQQQMQSGAGSTPPAGRRRASSDGYATSPSGSSGGLADITTMREALDASSRALAEIDRHALTKSDTAVLKAISDLVGKKLRSLSLEGRGLSQVAAPLFPAMAFLKDLNLSKNGLIELPGEIASMEHLVTLRLEGNRLEALPAEIGFLSSLKWLYLRGNRLAALPSTLGFLSELRGLNVSENALTSFPPTLGKLSKLRELNFRENDFADFPALVLRMSALETVVFDGNRFDDIPSEAFSMRKRRRRRNRSSSGSLSPGPAEADQSYEALVLEQASHLDNLAAVMTSLCSAAEASMQRLTTGGSPEAESEISVLCIELEQSERRESRLRDEARSLQEQVLHLKAERGVLADQLAASKSTAGRNQDAAAKVLGSLKMQKANLAEDLDAATSKCEALAAKLENATNELSAAQATNVTLMAAMSELETTVTTRAAVDASDALNQRDTEIANLKRQLAAVNDREDELARCHARIASLESSMIDRLAEVSSLENQIALSTNDVPREAEVKAVRRVRVLEAKVKDLKKRLSAAEGARDRLAAAAAPSITVKPIEPVVIVVDDAEASKGQADLVAALTARAEKAEARAERLATSLASVEGEMEAIRHQMLIEAGDAVSTANALQAEKRATERQLQDALSKVGCLESHVASMEGMKAELFAHVATVEEEKDALAARLAEVELMVAASAASSASPASAATTADDGPSAGEVVPSVPSAIAFEDDHSENDGPDNAVSTMAEARVAKRAAVDVPKIEASAQPNFGESLAPLNKGAIVDSMRSTLGLLATR